jgi:predicted metallo-beta-lactamase superfamily hydrolase
LVHFNSIFYSFPLYVTLQIPNINKHLTRGELMEIEILGTESLGVRGLSCVVRTRDHTIVIDPGVALGYIRYGFLPHPVQVAKGERVRQTIVKEVAHATDIVISHYHGDHVPLPNANPYQLKAQKIAPLVEKVRIWAKGAHDISRNMLNRLKDLRTVLNRRLPNAEGQTTGPLAFSNPVPHGDPHTRFGTVMMTCITDDETTFVHASDIQLLYEPTISRILEWHPTIVLASGPPIYLPWLSIDQEERAWKNAIKLADNVDTVILDHHLLRSRKGIKWLDALPSNVICAADFMGVRRQVLEAQRRQLYRKIPVPRGWHEAYAQGTADTKKYRKYRV